MAIRATNNDDGRRKPNAEDVKLIPPAAFEHEIGILFQVPKAEVDAIEAKRLKRPSPKRTKGAA